MKIKILHKAWSLVLSLLLIVTAFGAGIYASAEDGTSAPITNCDGWSPWANMSNGDFSSMIGDTNNLNGQFCDISFIEDGKLSEVASNFSDWSAGVWFNSKVAETDATLGPANGTTVTADKTVGQTRNYWRLRFKINGVLNNPEKFAFYSHRGNDNKHEISKHYAVFVSEKQDGDASTEIIDINNSSQRNGDVITVSGLNLTNIRYVEIRLYDTGRDNWTQAITEIGFFGGTIAEDKTITAHTSFANETDAQNAVTAAGTNHLSGQNYEDSTFHNGANLEQTETIKADEIANSTFFNSIIDDSNIGAWHTHSCESSRASTDIFQTSDYREMVIGLSEAVNNPEKFVFSFHPGGGLPSRHYSVYMSDKRDTLFDDVSKVIEITDSKARVGDLIDLTGLNIKKVLYVGIRIYSFGITKGCKIQHISEIGLYGGLVIGPMGDMNMDTKVDILDLIRLKKYNADSTVAIDETNELLVDFEGSSAQLAALRKYLLTGSWHMPTLFADEGYTYVWGDEFNAQTLNSDKWVNEVVEKNDTVIASNETNLTLEDSSLNLRVNGEKKKDGTTLYHIAEGLRTHSTMNFQYGYLEMRVKTPIQGGIGSAFWLSGLCGPETSTTYNSLTWDYNFKDYGTEIDILEQYRRTGVFYTTLHKWYPGAVNAYSYNDITHKIDGEYHTYGFKWTPNEMSVYVDGAKCYSYDLSENFDKTGYNTTMDGFRSPHYLRITNDVTTDIEIEGGPELTADVDCTLSVDWIRLYQIPGVGGLWTK